MDNDFRCTFDCNPHSPSLPCLLSLPLSHLLFLSLPSSSLPSLPSPFPLPPSLPTPLPSLPPSLPPSVSTERAAVGVVRQRQAEVCAEEEVMNRRGQESGESSWSQLLGTVYIHRRLKAPRHDPPMVLRLSPKSGHIQDRIPLVDVFFFTHQWICQRAHTPVPERLGLPIAL